MKFMDNSSLIHFDSLSKALPKRDFEKRNDFMFTKIENNLLDLTNSSKYTI